MEATPAMRAMGEAMAGVANLLEAEGLGSQMVVVGKDDLDCDGKIRSEFADVPPADMERIVRAFRENRESRGGNGE